MAQSTFIRGARYSRVSKCLLFFIAHSSENVSKTRWSLSQRFFLLPLFSSSDPDDVRSRLADSKHEQLSRETRVPSSLPLFLSLSGEPSRILVSCRHCNFVPFKRAAILRATAVTRLQARGKSIRSVTREHRHPFPRSNGKDKLPTVPASMRLNNRCDNNRVDWYGPHE